MNNIDRTPLRWNCADSISVLELYLPEVEIYKVYNLTDQLIPIVNSESALGSARCENGEEILQMSHLKNCFFVSLATSVAIALDPASRHTYNSLGRLQMSVSEILPVSLNTKMHRLCSIVYGV